jgi:hypothetical protein
MASLMGARRRAEEFAAAVDGGTPPEQLSPQTRELLDVVSSMRGHELPAPRAEFAAALREQLVAEAESALSPGSPLVLSPRRHGARERRLTAAAAVFTLVGGSAGLAAAAQDALPGEALYPLKRGIENVQLRVQSDPDDKGRTYLSHAGDRLTEAERLVDEGADSAQTAHTVDSFVVQTVAGADLLLSSFQEKRDPEDVEVLREFTADALPRLQGLAETAPADLQDELARAAVVVQRIDQQAAAACAECSDLPSLEMPVLMAQAAEISRAMEAVRDRSLNNDHPTLGVRLPGPGTGTDSTQEPSDDSLLGTGTAEGPRLGVKSPNVLPKDPEQALKELDDASGGLLGQVSSTTEKTSKELQDGLDDAVGSTLDQGDTLLGD